MRILFVITGLQSGGSETQLASLASQLHAAQDVLVISLTPGGIHADALKKQGVIVRSFTSHNPFSLIRAVRREVIHFKPDVIHAWLWHASMTCRLACIGLGVPLISAMRGQEPTRVRYWIERVTRPLVTHYTANSLYIAHYYALTKQKYTYIPNGWPDAVWNNPKLLTIKRKEKQAIAVSRLVREKDLTTLIRAFAIATDWHLRIVSTGPREAELKALVRELGLTNVEFLGYRSDVHRLITESSCLIHLAFEESSPNAVIEAMLLGTPVIASDIPALRELAADRGVLVPNGAPEKVASALRALHRTPGKATVRKTQQWAQARFALPTMTAAHIELYRKLQRTTQQQ